MEKRKGRIFPLITTLVFMSLFLAIIVKKGTIPTGQIFPIALGLLSYSLILTDVFISLRLKTAESRVGLPIMYRFHGIMGLVSFIFAIGHIGSQIRLKDGILNLSPTAFTGFITAILLFTTVLTGVLILSNMFTKKSKKLNNLKENAFKRESGLFIHKLSIFVSLFIFAHIMSVEFIRGNIVFILLSGLYMAMVVGMYFYMKIKRRSSSQYVLVKNYQRNSNVFELEFQPMGGSPLTYKPGQYIFIKFIKSKLPNESHPFSITSNSITDKSSLNVMIKKSGDYTNHIDLLSAGDIAIFEGPYGNFLDDSIPNTNNPFVMLAGGIGITPILSILRNEINNKVNRKIILVWGLASEKELFLFEELNKIKEENENFSFHVVLSREKTEQFDFGRITAEYLDGIEVSKLYNKAYFFICGPLVMMDSMKSILKDKKVDASMIRIEEFSF